MFNDNYANSNSFIFEHKEREPRYLRNLYKIFCLIGILMLFLCVKGINDQKPLYLFSLAILVLCAFLIGIVASHANRFNFYYIVTLNEDSFSIGIPDRYTIRTEHFPRKTTYQFKEKSRLVYIRDTFGFRCAFKYDEKFRKFLEEIQII